MHEPQRESIQRKILRDIDMQKNPAIHNQQILLLQELLRTVALQGYRFTTVTPLTHQRFFASSNGIAKNIRDIFGWNLLFKSNLLPPLVFELMSQADLLINANEYCQSKIRISSLNDDLFLHSRFPTNDEHSVFFGPDTYRFARFIQQSLKVLQFESGFTPNGQLRILDVGCGSGAGGIAAIRALQNQHQYSLTLNDLNPVALDYATVCAQVAAVSATMLSGDFFNVQHKQFDLILCNPPYIRDPAARLYRDGGSLFGLELSLRITKHALGLLSPGGRLLLYTGVAMTNDEKNPLLAELMPHFSSGKFRWSYEEIDPDIFSEELGKPEYHGVNRIAAVGLIIESTR